MKLTLYSSREARKSSTIQIGVRLTHWQIRTWWGWGATRTRQRQGSLKEVSRVNVRWWPPEPHLLYFVEATKDDSIMGWRWSLWAWCKKCAMNDGEPSGGQYQRLKLVQRWNGMSRKEVSPCFSWEYRGEWPGKDKKEQEGKGILRKQIQIL